MKISEELVVVRSVPYDEMIWDLEPQKVWPVLELSALPFVGVLQQQACHQQSSRFVVLQSVQKGLHCST